MSSPGDNREWYESAGVEDLPSPALLVYRERVEENLKRMLLLAGGPDRLRPHIKTHKMPDLVRLQISLGITRFKCATIAEAEMAAEAGVPDLLIAYQPVGPAIGRLIDLHCSFPQLRLGVIADDPDVIRLISQAAHQAESRQTHPTPIEVLLDLDIGQHRTGVPIGPTTKNLYELIASLPGIRPGGLHAYDGHLSEPDPARREAACDQAFAPVEFLRRSLEQSGLPVPRVVTSGTPTFPFHARRKNVECSPGTCVFWDAGYSKKFPDLSFLPAALVITRVVSKPGADRLCLDLGHKAIGSEMPPPRVCFLNLPEAQPITHSEEHLVVETPHSSRFKLGDVVYGLPWHICPTVALYSEATVIEKGRSTGTWPVRARNRRLSI
jgi:D-serine deaminase-like pyridoxal phosphate-dependent protein